jgi:V/A-type H+-transporting ATPase subunit A
VGKMLREDFLQQSAFSENDAYCPMEKQDGMLKAILIFYQKTSDIIRQGGTIETILESPYLERIARLKDTPIKEWKNVSQQILKEIKEWNLQPATITQ